jgi:hypothetical protein
VNALGPFAPIIEPGMHSKTMTRVAQYKAAVVRKDWAEAERLALEDVVLFAACKDWLDRYMLAYAAFLQACPCPDCATRH